ncbi:MAG: 16S rRNA (uracil(1498)-N(3))-methyltransferase [Xanthomonadales bacterium]|nr:16S rRNA (uracil(1498)-N(3))-methyltransferase [Xanthomonadales bacterium]
MKLRRIYLQMQLSVAAEIQLEGAQAHYLARVLRLRAGHNLEVFNGDGNNYSAEILRVSKKALSLKIKQCSVGIPASKIEINLVQALTRGERLDYSLQKATELGVNTIQLLLTERVELHLEEKRLQRRMQHWQQVIISACEQSGRSDVPVLSEPLLLADYLAIKPACERLVLDPQAQQGVSGIALSSGSVDLLIGPEGGFTEVELLQFAAENVQAMRIGPRTLRSETAGPAAIAIIQQYYGDLN